MLVGGSASFTVVAIGIPAPTYQWFFGSNAISSATAATFTLTNVQAAQAGSYWVTVTNAAGSLSSSPAALVVQQAPQITSQPQASQTVLVGETASFTVVAVGISAPTYQWFLGANAIPGATAATYAIAGVQANQAGSYSVAITNAVGSITSSPAVLVVQQAPQITTQPLASQTALVGGAASFTVVATGIPAPTYQWFFGANAISGATKATYAIKSVPGAGGSGGVQAAQAGTYTVAVTNVAGSVTSSPATLVVQQAPQITSQPQASQTVLVGGTASFTVVATGIPAPTYQWFLGANAISGATAATYAIGSVQPNQAGSYTVTVTNSAGSVSSSPAILVVQQAPQITSQPQASQTVLVGGTASFTVVATGIPAPTYQWFLGANAISGATAATYMLASVQASQAGSYTVTVTNAAGGVTSSPAALIVQQAPQITSQPQASQTVLVGGTASFTVVATGIPAPTYQWFFGANAISGATSATYSIASVQADQAGSYTVTVTNPAGSVTSSAAVLVVQQPPQITGQPQASQTVLVGGSASFTVVATGIPSPTYQWFFGANAISGATAATYSLTNVQASQAGSYSVTVANAAGTVTSSASALVVQQAPQITSQPQASQTVLVGGTASFTVLATGIPAPTYQWFLGANAISGATAAIYTLPNVQANQAGSYTVTVTNAAGSVTSSPAILVVQQAPQITTQPQALQTVLVGGSASFTVVAVGIPDPTYQWFFGINAISGATAATYAIASVQPNQAGSYSVTVTNAAGTVTSSASALVVQQAPQITSQPLASQTVLVGGSASFTVVATGIPAPTYQWFLGANAISGATAAIYTLPNVQANQAGSYTVTVTNSAGSVTSSTGALAVQQPPQITTQPLALQTVTVGGSASFTVVATGIPAPTYQWFFGANAISGATAATYAIASVQANQTGSYTVTVTNSTGSVTSSPAILVVQQAPQITSQPQASQTVTVGGTASFTVVATGIPAPTYQWSFGANSISGATSATYSIASVQPNQAGCYTVTVTNAAGSVTSSTATLVVQQAPQITSQPQPSQAVLVGGSASFAVIATGIPVPTYQWFFGANAISGATAATYSITNVQAAQAGSYSVAVTNAAGSVTSAASVLVVQQAPQITTQPQALQTVLVGGSASFTVVAVGIPDPTYQWFFGANAISGATAATYTLSNVQAAQAGSYTVTVTDSAGSVTSSAAALVVQQAPQITTQPLASQTVTVGDTASFTVIATGIPAPTYQWFFGANAISGATAATYTLPNVQAAQAGSYSVTVTNAAGSVTSSPAILVVQQAPQITTQPQPSQTVLVGGTASFTVVATGIPAPTYQWFFASNAIPGATAAIYTLPNVQANQAGSYTVTVTNAAGTVTSSASALVVQQAPQITSQPLASQTVLVGGSASFTVVATGIPAPTYQWFFGANAISGATAATYTIVSVPGPSGAGGVPATLARTYTVKVTNVVGSINSSPAVLIVQQRPQITTQPLASQIVLVGGTASFTVVATGIPAPTYQWYLGPNAISGATAAIYTLPNAQPAQAGSYTVTVTNAAGSVTSSSAALVVQQTPN